MQTNRYVVYIFNNRTFFLVTEETLSLTILIVSILFVFSISIAAFTVYIHTKRGSVSGTGLVELLFLANFFYIFGYAMELVSPKHNVEANF